jgi:serine/threonine protein phosphatase PrpC
MLIHRNRLRIWLVSVILCAALEGCTSKLPSSDTVPIPAANPANADLRLLIGKCSLTGNFREFNDDVIATKEAAGASLCLVGDGMGGIGTKKPLGVIACECAFDMLTKELQKNLPAAATPEENQRVIRRAIVAANKEIIATAESMANSSNMGTTIVLALWRQEPRIYIASVGDSRAYLVGGNQIQQLSVDDSLAQALVQSKTITPEEARVHRFRNVLWKYLGSKEVGDGPEVKVVPLQVGERILLCTDGLHGVVKDEQIKSCMQAHTDVQKCADAEPLAL